MECLFVMLSLLVPFNFAVLGIVMFLVVFWSDAQVERITVIAYSFPAERYANGEASYA